jgi:hypothetical protein
LYRFLKKSTSRFLQKIFIPDSQRWLWLKRSIDHSNRGNKKILDGAAGSSFLLQANRIRRLNGKVLFNMVVIAIEIGYIKIRWFVQY